MDASDLQYYKLVHSAKKIFTKDDSKKQVQKNTNQKTLLQTIQDKILSIKKRNNKLEVFKKKNKIDLELAQQNDSFKQYKNGLKKCKSSNITRCNKQYKKFFNVCDQNQCDSPIKDYINITKNSFYHYVLDMNTKNVNEPNVESSDLEKSKYRIRNYLEKDNSGEFENYVHMFMSIIFTDYQSLFVDCTYPSNQNVNEKLKKLVSLLIASKHWSYRYISHFNPLNTLKWFHQMLMYERHVDVDKSQMFLFITECLIQYYERYFVLNKGSFCHTSIAQVIIDICWLSFSENERTDNLSTWFNKISNNEWQFIATEYYKSFIDFVSSIWNPNDQSYKKSIIKYKQSIIVVMDIIRLKGISFYIYEQYVRLSEKLSKIFQQSVQQNENQSDLSYCIFGNVLNDRNIFQEYENECQLVSILMARNTTNFLFLCLDKDDSNEYTQPNQIVKRNVIPSLIKLKPKVKSNTSKTQTHASVKSEIEKPKVKFNTDKIQTYESIKSDIEKPKERIRKYTSEQLKPMIITSDGDTFPNEPQTDTPTLNELPLQEEEEEEEMTDEELIESVKKLHNEPKYEIPPQEEIEEMIDAPDDGLDDIYFTEEEEFSDDMFDIITKDPESQALLFDLDAKFRDMMYNMEEQKKSDAEQIQEWIREDEIKKAKKEKEAKEAKEAEIEAKKKEQNENKDK